MTVLRALTDPTRVRLLCALEDEELTVAELQRVLDMPQSRVSTHLGRLREAGLALDRTDGPHRYYRLQGQNGQNGKSGHAPASVAPRLWQTLKDSLADDAQLERDRQRRDQVVAARRGAGVTWVDRVAGSLDRHYSPGRTWEALARALTLVADLGDVADLGAGDGAIAELLASSARRIVGIDSNQRMVEAGQERLKRGQLSHVELIRGDMHQTPLPSASWDFVLVQQSLQYAADPAAVFREAARLLRPGGRALVVTLAAHKNEEARTIYGHVHLGFRPAQLQKWARAAGLEVVSVASAGRERRPPQFEALAALFRAPFARRS
jgi:ArsR family transcriptional regulator